MASINNRAVILLSGGVDSAVSAYLLSRQAIELEALTFIIEDGSMTSISDLKCAKMIASKLKLQHTIIDFSCLIPLLNGFLNKEESDSKIERKDRAIPFGVEMMLIAALMYATTHNIERIIWSINRDDIGSKMTPNDISEYIRCFEKLTRFRKSDISCKIETPLLLMKKTEVVSFGERLGVQFENTFSCLLAHSEMIHCGKCEQCIQRTKAFEILKKGGENHELA